MNRSAHLQRMWRELVDLRCTAAALGKHFLRTPVTYLRESAQGSPKWIKRRLPRAYFHLTLRPAKEWYAHLRADAVLVSFPKCGRTWLRTMIDRAIELEYERPPLQLQVIHEDDPFWRTPPELARGKSEYRHKKVLLLTRDPRDVLVSSYFHKHDRQHLYAGTLADYLDEPVGGIETIATYASIWRANATTPRGFLEVRYEELHADPETTLDRVLHFLDAPVTRASVREAVRFASFDAMRARELAARGGDVNPASLKAREGRVGGHRSRLTPEQIAALDARLAALTDIPLQS